MVLLEIFEPIGKVGGQNSPQNGFLLHFQPVPSFDFDETLQDAGDHAE